MKRLMLMFSALAISCLFMVFSPTGTMGFPYSKVTMPAENWYYYFFEHVILVLLALAIVSEATEYRVALWVFVAITVADVIDYVLFYGERWRDYLPTFNIIKLTVFGLAIVYERVKKVYE